MRTTLALLLALAVTAVAAPAEDSQKLIDILKSDASPAEKAITCKRLAIWGTKDAVPFLAPLLADEKLASWARIALEAIPDPAADDALRAALDKLQGRLLVGTINSIGVRRDAKAVSGLVAKLKDADADVASAAAVALGHIGGDTVAKTLMPLLADAPAAVRPAMAEGCIYCAENYLRANKRADAIKLYDAVRSAKISKQKTVEAIRGAILARQAAGVPLLAEQLKSEDKTFFNIGLHTARELPGREVTQALLAELDRTTPERQSYLLLALADRGDTEALPAALKAAQAGRISLRITAISVLERLGNMTCVPVLLAATAEDDPDLVQAAKSALTRLSGAEVDAAVIATLKQPDEKARRAAIELVGQRRLTNAVPALLTAAADSNADIRTTSLKVLADLAGTADIPALLNILLTTKDTEAAGTTLAAVCARLTRPITGNVVIQKAVYGDLAGGQIADVTAKVTEIIKAGSSTVSASNDDFGDPASGTVKQLRVDYTVNGIPGSKTVPEGESVSFTVSAIAPVFVDAICAAMTRATPTAKLALLRILRAAGGPKALATVRAAAADRAPNAVTTIQCDEIRETARRTLCDWPTADALPDVTRIAKTAPDQTFKILALRAQLRLIPQQSIAAEQRLTALKEAMTLIERNEEKRLALSALSEIPTAESLALVTSYLATEGLKEEASTAAVSIAEKIVAKHPAAVLAAMKQVQTNNKKLAQRVQKLQAQAQK